MCVYVCACVCACVCFKLRGYHVGIRTVWMCRYRVLWESFQQLHFFLYYIIGIVLFVFCFFFLFLDLPHCVWRAQPHLWQLYAHIFLVFFFFFFFFFFFVLGCFYTLPHLTTHPRCIKCAQLKEKYEKEDDELKETFKIGISKDIAQATRDFNKYGWRILIQPANYYNLDWLAASYYLHVSPYFPNCMSTWPPWWPLHKNPTFLYNYCF